MTNYETTKHQMAHVFLRYDQEPMIARFGLRSDETFLYIRLLDLPYRINRFSGKVEQGHPDSEGMPDFSRPVEATYHEAMVIYDVLCYAKDNYPLSGDFVLLQSLATIQGSSGALGHNFFQSEARAFDKHREELVGACESLGGIPFGKGDVSFKFPFFPFFPVVFQFWESDDEFPASIQLLFDRQAVMFMHYESLWFAATHLLARLRVIMNSNDTKGTTSGA